MEKALAGTFKTGKLPGASLVVQMPDEEPEEKYAQAIIELRTITVGIIERAAQDAGVAVEIVKVETREELGRSPADLDAQGQIVLSVIRKGISHRFDTNTISRLESGDRLVVIRHNPSER